MRDVFAIYDNNISPGLLMIIIKIIILYFIQIRHTDDFPPTGTPASRPNVQKCATSRVKTKIPAAKTFGSLNVFLEGQWVFWGASGFSDSLAPEPVVATVQCQGLYSVEGWLVATTWCIHFYHDDLL